MFWPKIEGNQEDPQRLLGRGSQPAGRTALCLAFALIALAAITRGRRARGAYALRLTIATLAAGAVRILGYGVQGIGARNPEFDFLIYLVPLGGAALALVHAGGLVARKFCRARAGPEPEPAS